MGTLLRVCVLQPTGGWLFISEWDPRSHQHSPGWFSWGLDAFGGSLLVLGAGYERQSPRVAGPCFFAGVGIEKHGSLGLARAVSDKSFRLGHEGVTFALRRTPHPRTPTDEARL